MTSITVRLEGQAQLVRQLRALGGPKLREIARKVVRTAMAPVMAEAKANTPKVSGQLEASIGELVQSRKSSVTARVGTRRDFTFRDTSGTRMAQGRGKRIDKAVSKGAVLTKYSAQQYARGIETGTSRDGRVRRKAGGVHMLDNAINDQKSSIINNVATDLRRFVDTTR